MTHDLIALADELARRLDPLRCRPPVTHVYNPLVYAREAHADYLRRYGSGAGRIVLIGMNPGPWGMAQTGVPFGEVRLVRDWLGVRGRIDKPHREHPARPVEGFHCRRSEVSGARLWGWARNTFDSPHEFFRRFFVLNYCPLMFLEDSGRNRTPDRLPAEQRSAIESACDCALRRTIEILNPSLVIGVGGFAETRARIALAEDGVPIGRIPHPSPASPSANRDWPGQVRRSLHALGIALPKGISRPRWTASQPA